MSSYITAAAGISVVIVNSRPLRTGLVICNVGAAGLVYLTLGPVASTLRGILLVPNGGSYSQGAGEYTGVITAFSPSVALNLGVSETYYET